MDCLMKLFRCFYADNDDDVPCFFSSQQGRVCSSVLSAKIVVQTLHLLVSPKDLLPGSCASSNACSWNPYTNRPVRTTYGESFSH